MKMANITPVMFVILLSGIVSTGSSQCPQIVAAECKCPTESRGPGFDALCSAIPPFIACAKGLMEVYDTNEKEMVKEALKYFRGLYSKDCDDATPGQISSLFMCFGMASLAYFLTKLR